ncbi:MAG: gamma-glutamyltransferase, partial [Gemmatimonadota bacterium]
AAQRARLIDPDHNAPDVKPGDPYPFMGETTPFKQYLADGHTTKRYGKEARDSQAGGAQAMSGSAGARLAAHAEPGVAQGPMNADAGPDASADVPSGFFAGTTSIEAADEKGWVVSVTPSGGWPPAVIAGHTGVGLSQRAQSFVLYPAEDPFNVIHPGQRPRATLTPGIALKDGKPYLSFAVQGGDTQDQNLLQFFLDIVDFGMNVQQAAEAPNITSYQMRSSFGDHESMPGRLTLNDNVPPWVRAKLRSMGYRLDFQARTSGPINAIFFDQKHHTFWGGSSNYGEDYGIAW